MTAEAPVEFDVVDLVEATEKTPTLADIERIEGKLLMAGLNTELPVNHTFLPHVYMREVFMPKGFIVIGHEHVHACDNVMLCGRIRLVVDGKVKELTAPCVMRSEAHTRKIAYVLEDCIWATLHKTDETDVEKLEDALIVKSDAFLDYESQKQIDQLREYLSITNNPDFSNEEWRPVVEFEGKYEVSNMGRVRTLSYNRTKEVRVMKPGNNRGYLTLSLQRGAQKPRFTVHRLVAAAFIGPRPDGYAINHKNGIKTDNRVCNLEYVTPSQNQKHSFAHGLQTNVGEHHSQHKLTNDKVVEIRARVANGETQTAVARDIGIDQGQISRICRGLAWGHIEESKS